MPKVKVKRKSTALDMAPMCDMAFLLLTFFILTSNFIQKEVVQVSTPSSISEIKIPERDIMLILIDKSNHVFFGIDGQETRKEVLSEVGNAYGIEFSKKELEEFSVVNNFGLPISGMKKFLSLSAEQRDMAENAIGIPTDSIDNQLKQWVKAGRAVNPNARIAIKADQGCAYPIIKKVMNSLQDLQENRYNLITSLEENPEKINIK